RFLLFFLITGFGVAESFAQPQRHTDFIKLSQDFLYAARTDGNPQPYIDSLANADEDELAAQLNDDARKKVFFINIYHAYTQAILKKDPTKFNNRNKFFHKHQILMAGNFLSLDHIANGLLRHSK